MFFFTWANQCKSPYFIYYPWASFHSYVQQPEAINGYKWIFTNMNHHSYFIIFHLWVPPYTQIKHQFYQNVSRVFHSSSAPAFLRNMVKGLVSGKIETGNHGFSHGIWGFPFNQTMELGTHSCHSSLDLLSLRLPPPLNLPRLCLVTTARPLDFAASSCWGSWPWDGPKPSKPHEIPSPGEHPEHPKHRYPMKPSCFRVGDQGFHL